MSKIERIQKIQNEIERENEIKERRKRIIEKGIENKGYRKR